MLLKLSTILLVAFVHYSKGQYNTPSFAPGRTTLVHLFEWKWSNIADECERFLGPKGYAGVQVSPPNENAAINEPPRPWWERYQPVSYKLETRSGNEAAFADMVKRCNAVDVRIIVDVVSNHMTHFSTVGTGTGGSSFNSDSKEYPGVGFVAADFHSSECPTASGQIEDHLDPVQSRFCEMGGLRDLNQGRPTVRTAQIDFLSKLINFGVAGFRIDSAKQQVSADLKFIFDALPNLPTSEGFPANTRPFVFQEIIMFDEEPIKGSEYFPTGRLTELKYGFFLGQAIRKQQPLANLADFGEATGFWPSEYSLVFTDNHDNQRGHGAGGGTVISHQEDRMYKIANAFMLAWPYGLAKVMSSYVWSGLDSDSWVGPPNTNGNTDDVIIKPDSTCDGGWVCEHRWRQIRNMVEFRNVVEGTTVDSWWDNGANQIAFCRGSKGFLVINNDNSDLDMSLKTCLPAGNYCDVITGDIEDGKCNGRVITVALSGEAEFFIPAGDEEAAIAIHTNSRIP